jgi:peptidoglycan/LPS O-acetylase OafA/YrhL
MLDHTRRLEERNIPRDRKAFTPLDERSGGGRDAVLDGLRTVAVASVIASHALRYRFADTIGEQFDLLHRALIPAAHSGISVLFMISGYVITRLLWVERTKQGSVHLSAFWGRRSLRVIPPFFCLLAAIAFMRGWGYIGTPYKEMAVSGLFLCNTGVVYCSWFVNHTWTLGIEEQFYWIWPALFLFTPRRHVDAVLMAIIATLLIIGILRSGGGYNNEGPFMMVAVGALVATHEPLQRFLVQRVGGIMWFSAGIALVAAAAITPPVVEYVLRPVLLMVLVFGVGNLKLPSAILKTRPFQIIGACAYSIYLWQQVFLGHPSYYDGAPPPLWLLPVVVALSYLLVEKPTISAGKVWTRFVVERRKARQAGSPMPVP